MSNESTMNGWAVIAAVVTAFTGSVITIGKMAGPVITSWAANRARKLEAQAMLAEDVLVHQRERDERDSRIERRLETLERRVGRVSDVIHRRCGRHEEPGSDLDIDPPHDSVSKP